MKKVISFVIMLFIAVALSACAKSGGMDNNNAENHNQEFQPPAESLDIRLLAVPDKTDYENTSTIAEGYVYYLGDNGTIYQAPIDDVNNPKAVFHLPGGNLYSSDGYAVSRLTNIDGKAILKYHIGGASMGTDYAVILHPDGSYEELDNNYSSTVTVGENVVELVSGYPSHALRIRRKGEKEFTLFGDEGYIYGMYVITDWQKATCYIGNSDLAAVGSDVYVLAQKCASDNEELNEVGLYKIDIETNETKRVFSNHQIKHFQIYGEYIYFTDFSGFLYKAGIHDNDAVKIADVAMNIFFVVGEDIYYTPFNGINQNGGQQKLFRLGEDNPLVPGCVLEWPEMNANMNEGYLSCMLYELDSYPLRYKGIIIGETGEAVVIEESDVRYVTVYDGVIYVIVSSK